MKKNTALFCAATFIGAVAQIVLWCGQALAQDASPETPPPEATMETIETTDMFKTIQKENSELKRTIVHLGERIDALEKKNADSELQALIAAAEKEAESDADDDNPSERKFLWGALALQKLNPEISISADLMGTLIIDDEKRMFSQTGERSGFALREVGLHVQHTLDPYSSFKGAIAFIPGPDPEVAVEEMYITWFGFIPSLSLTAGRFRQNFGVVNRWHAHDLDQSSYPLALRMVMGDDGLSATGVMVKWFMPPVLADANELLVEVTNAENETLLAGEYFSVPAVVGHFKNYWDLSDNTYLELGISGLWGMNNQRGYFSEDTNELRNAPWRQTLAGGMDLTVQWTPLQKARYQSFTWRTEGYVAKMERTKDRALLQTGEADTDGKRYSFGVYSYFDFKLSEQFFVGIRGDVALPTVRSKTSYAWDVVPYITFWQSEFVYFRLEYAHEAKVPESAPDGNLFYRTDDRVMLQVNFAAGPHKHEKY